MDFPYRPIVTIDRSYIDYITDYNVYKFYFIKRAL